MEIALKNVQVPRITRDELERLNAHFRTASAESLLDWATEQFGKQIVLTCSFGGASGMVLLDMVARLQRDTPVVFLDTGLLFPETNALTAEVERHYGITVQQRHPTVSLAEQEAQYGANLYERDPDRCCQIRKVTPLAETLQLYHSWISGIRRDQSSTRAATEPLQWSERYNLLKVNPLAFWTEQDVWRYVHKNHVPYNMLLDQGYPSLGCAPCTRPTTADDTRAGRWAGFAKTECGIHT